MGLVGCFPESQDALCIGAYWCSIVRESTDSRDPVQDLNSVAQLGIGGSTLLCGFVVPGEGGDRVHQRSKLQAVYLDPLGSVQALLVVRDLPNSTAGYHHRPSTKPLARVW